MSGDAIEKLFDRIDKLTEAQIRSAEQLSALRVSHDDLRVEVREMFDNGCGQRATHELQVRQMQQDITALQDRPGKTLGTLVTVGSLVGMVSGLGAFLMSLGKRGAP